MAEPQAPASSSNSPASVLLSSTLDSGKALLKSIQSYIVAAGALVAIVASALRMDPGHAVLSIAVGAVPLMAILLLKTLPEYRRRRQAAQLKAWAVEADDRPAGYFRLVPYEERDRGDFRRADGVHQAAVEFIRNSSVPLLYLTGVSGAGKTSLLTAYAIPELRGGTPAFRVIRIRGGDDPVGALRAALLRPAAIWKNPKKDDHQQSISELLDRSVAYLERSDERLLIVFDQFEELLCAQDREPQRFAAFNELLRGVKEQPPAGLRILLSFRDDYKGMLARLGLPVLEQNRNWLLVSPFAYSAACEFLARGFDHLGSEVLNRVLREAETYEDAPGQFRPITLNMVGRMLQRQPGAISAEDADRTLENDLRRTLRHDFHGQLVLNALISTRGTRQARTVAELATELDLEPEVVEGACCEMQTEGFVRRLNRPDLLSERAWEISHDFVARLLVAVLRHSPPTIWQHVRPWLFPATLLLTGLAVALIVWHQHNVPKRAADRLRNSGLRVFGAADSGWTVEYTTDRVDQPRPWPETLRDLDLLGPIQELTLWDPPVKNCESFAALPALASLSTLRLVQRASDSTDTASPPLELNSLAGIEELTQLESLELNNLARIEDLSRIAQLDELRSLIIRRCDRIEQLPELDLKKLTTLQISGCGRLRDVSQIGKLTSLRHLTLAGCDAVQTIPLTRLVELEYLDLNGNDGLKTEPLDVSGLNHVAFLDLNGSNDLTRITGLGDLVGLTSLNLAECEQLALDEQAVARLLRLESLNLNRCKSVQSAVVVSLSTSLTHLHVRELQIDEDALRTILQMKSLQELSLQGSLPADAIARIRHALPDCRINHFALKLDAADP